MSPLAYYRDSPVLVKDKVIDGYIRTSATPAGQKADALYLERIAAATRHQRRDHALQRRALSRGAGAQYRSALAMPAANSCACSTAST